MCFICSTFVCPTEITAFSDRISQFNAINTNVVGCSCDSHFTHLAWINTPRNVRKLFILEALDEEVRYRIEYFSTCDTLICFRKVD